MFDKNKDNRKRVTTGKEEKKKKTCVNNSPLFITLSPTGTEVTDFNDLDSQSFDALEHIVDSDHKCIEDIGNNDVINQHSSDNEEGFKRE
jgi:hypothetical protein